MNNNGFRAYLIKHVKYINYFIIIILYRALISILKILILFLLKEIIPKE